MKDGQDAIYYITADSYAAARHSPHLEIFRKLGVEVLLLHDRIDEWVVSSLTEFDGKPLQSVAQGRPRPEQASAAKRRTPEENHAVGRAGRRCSSGCRRRCRTARARCG